MWTRRHLYDRQKMNQSAKIHTHVDLCLLQSGQACMSIFSLSLNPVQRNFFLATVTMPTGLPKIHQSPADSLFMQKLQKRQYRDQTGEGAVQSQ